MQTTRAFFSEVFRTIAVSIPLIALVLTNKHALSTLTLVFATSVLSQWLFTRNRNRSLGIDIFHTAFLFTLLLPDHILWWQLILCVSFGVVFGEQIYGGRGFSFVSPVITGLAFLFYSFQFDQSQQLNDVPPWILVIPLAVVVWRQLLSWPITCGFAAGLLFVFYLGLDSPQTSIWEDIKSLSVPTMTVLTCLLFITADSATSPVTTLGRWVYGIMLGALVAILDPSFSLLEKVVFAALLSTIAVPLLDWLCVRLNNKFKSAPFKTQNAGDSL